jgi:flagellar hook assembly protein FlgD
VVLRLEGNGNDTELKFQLAFGADELMHPYDVAWDDGGTPFDASDDLIWVADTGHGRILGYAISGGAAELRYEYGSVGNGTGSFFEPTVVAVGRFNGVANGVLYVADTGNRRLVQLAVRGSELEWAAAYSGKEESQFTAIDVDHWGNVYAADHSYRELIKFSSGLEPLAVLKSDDASLIDPLNFHVTFGKVYVQSENHNYWAGYDQAFVVEKWSESSGGERYQLGIDLTDLAVELSGDLDEVSVRSKLTDHGKVNLAIIDQTSDVPIRQMALGWMIPGDKNVSWDRRDNLGWQVEPGYYRLQLTAESSYGNFAITKETQPFYLPLYYWEDSGANAYRDAHLIQGSRSSAWGNAPHQSIAKHPSEVVYRFSELNPTVDYEIKAEFYNPAGHYLKQSISVDGAVIFDEFEVTADIKSLGWQPLPKEIYADGQMDIRITKTAGAGDAVISQLWVREANFDPAHPPVLQDSPNPVPREFTLLQNYPNPFNPSTTIEFGVPNLSLLPLEEGTSSSPLEGGTPPFNSPLEGGSRGVLVTLRIFNVKGQTVRELVNEALPPGQYSVVWNGRDDFGRPLASGVYFYQLKAGDVQQVKRLILMK